ncbi:polyprenyl diphosphate synthase [Silvanigrella aquatica]|uniref:Isoprenyl transferase n=1 Tax=Silvanigrella aquatica TaxID=1915309 RepID=A0A1L4D1N7_9BACT|nr:polyprenyl diphosphate synthase [Silvanigrella aquatica]APJ04119.1 di-trans,poly-cis-decaprenylcistransferase [Silvanigrella aquatica]
MINYCEKWDLNPLLLPRHIGIIMDGNGRWAAKRHLPRIAGHRKGVERVQEITELSGNIGITALTLFAFSDENWRRPEDEVGGIMGLLRWYIRKEHKRIVDNNVQFRVIGDRRKLSMDIIELIEELEQDTEKNTGMHLSVALSYGAHGEILRAVKKIVDKVQEGNIFKDDIDACTFESCLDTQGLPPLDMFIRTSGEYRVSNFLLWQLAYAELFFDDVLWPDFDSEKFISLVRQFSLRERRFGMTSEQIAQKIVAHKHY